MPELPGFTSHSIEVNGTEIHYVTGGQGDPLVLIHGWPQSWYEWHRIMPTLAQNHTLIVPDLRGVGGSTPTVDGYDKLNLAEDMHQLAAELGYTSVDVAGHDIGGMVAFAWALSYPDEVASATIMDVPIPSLDPWAFVEGVAWHFGFHQAADELAERLVQGHQAEYFSHFYEDFSFDGSPFDEADVQVFADAYASDEQLRAGFEFYRAFPRDEQDVMAATGTPLTMPILVMGGETSLGAAIEPAQASLLQFGATDVQTHVVEGAGHWVADEQPEAVSNRLLQFIDEGT